MITNVNWFVGFVDTVWGREKKGEKKAKKLQINFVCLTKVKCVSKERFFFDGKESNN